MKAYKKHGRPSQAEIDRVTRENERSFRDAGVDINKGRLTRADAARVNAALAALRKRKS